MSEAPEDTRILPRPRQRRTNLRSATVPFPPVEDLRALLGFDESDTSHDAQIEAVLNACLAMIENYCGRVFEEGDYVQEFAPLDARDPVLILRAWPVSEVASVTRNGETLTGWQLYAQSGMLRQHHHYCGWWPTAYHWRDEMVVVVSYTGGYPLDAWPADLVDILTRLFMDRWNATGGTGNPADEGHGAGAIKSATVDGMTIAYDVGDSSAGAETGVTSGDIPPDLAPYAAELEPWVDHRVYGI